MTDTFTPGAFDDFDDDDSLDIPNTITAPTPSTSTTLPLVETAGAAARTPDDWAAYINAPETNPVLAIIGRGKRLAEYKASVHATKQTGFEQFCKTHLRISDGYARKLIEIGKLEKSVHSVSGFLPASIGTLYELAHLSEAQLNDAVEAGKIRPEMTRADAETLAKELCSKPKRIRTTEGPKTKVPNISPTVGETASTPEAELPTADALASSVAPAHATAVSVVPVEPATGNLVSPDAEPPVVGVVVDMPAKGGSMSRIYKEGGKVDPAFVAKAFAKMDEDPDAAVDQLCQLPLEELERMQTTITRAVERLAAGQRSIAA